MYVVKGRYLDMAPVTLHEYRWKFLALLELFVLGRKLGPFTFWMEKLQ